MRIWGNLNGTVTGKGLGVAFYKIPGGCRAGIFWMPAGQPGHRDPAQSIICLSQLSKERKKGLHSCLRGKMWGGSRNRASVRALVSAMPCRTGQEMERGETGETRACGCWIPGLQGPWALGKARKVSMF